MTGSLSRREKFGAGFGCLIFLAILVLALSGTLRGMSLADYQPTQYQSKPANFGEVVCPSNRFDTFKHTAKLFARERQLAYQGRGDNETGTMFVVTLENQHQRLWLSAADSPAVLSQHLADGVTPSPRDKTLFDDLLRRLRRC